MSRGITKTQTKGKHNHGKEAKAAGYVLGDEELVKRQFEGLVTGVLIGGCSVFGPGIGASIY